MSNTDSSLDLTAPSAVTIVSIAPQVLSLFSANITLAASQADAFTLACRKACEETVKESGNTADIPFETLLKEMGEARTKASAAHDLVHLLSSDERLKHHVDEVMFEFPELGGLPDVSEAGGAENIALLEQIYEANATNMRKLALLAVNPVIHAFFMVIPADEALARKSWCSAYLPKDGPATPDEAQMLFSSSARLLSHVADEALARFRTSGP